MSINHNISEIVETEGHLIDSRLMTEIFDSVVKHGGAFEVLQFTIGRTNNDFSRLQMRVTASNPAAMQNLLEELLTFGCRMSVESDAALQAAPTDGCAPDDFYSTSNHHTWVRHQGEWLEVERQRMDAAIVIDHGRASCRKLRDLRAGDQVVCFLDGIRVVPEFRERDRHGFAFMTGGISSERHVETSVERIAEMIRDVKSSGGRTAFVVGPVVVHTGAAAYFCDLVRGDTWTCCSPAMRSPSTTSKGPSTAHRSGSASRPACPSKEGIGITCAPSTRFVARGASAKPSPPGS